ncbi:MAG: tetratricopeptide repeat protein [Limisphaerales bacterium]
MLPWLIAAAGVALYTVTLNRWVALAGLDVVSKVAGWDWNTMQLGPVTLLVTWPIRWLPAASQPVALNFLSAILAGLTLGLLAKSVALLPHDRTREQRQRERNDFSFLTIPTAWVPPVGAAAFLALQLTFWESATAMTGDMVNLALFAFCVFCFLRARILQDDRFLALLSFAFGAAAANDWGVIAFCPLFFAAILWSKGIGFFEAGFLIRTTLAGLAGTLFYLIPPIVLQATGQADGSIFELLRTQLAIQRTYILAFPRATLAFSSLASILPLLVMAIRWPSTFGDMSAAGSAITNFMFRLVHVAFFAVCGWAMFDPPFSPRQLGFGYPFLHFYFLTALSLGYFAGYLLLVLGQEPERKMKRSSDGMQAVGRLAAGLVVVATFAAAAGLAFRNLPTIRGQNGPLLREIAGTLADVPPGNTVLTSDDNDILMLAVGALKDRNADGAVIPINTGYLRRHVYQRHHELRYGGRWPALAIERLSDPLGDDVLLRQMAALTVSNQLFYLHPSFGYYFEVFHLVPTNTIYAFDRQATNSFLPAAVPDDQFETVHQHWTRIREQYVDNPVIARFREMRVSNAPFIAAHLARALNTWGVLLQRRNRLDDAGRFFGAAKELNPDNISAAINVRFNENLRAGRRDPITLSEELSDQIGRFRDLPTFLSICGPVDEPSFCFQLGRVFADGNLHRQAAVQFARAVELQPDSLETRMWLANASLNANFPGYVLQIVDETRKLGLELTPSQSADLFGLEAWAHFRRGDPDKAQSILLEAERRYPERHELVQTLTDIYLAANQTNAALASAERLAARLPGDPRPLITKSALQMQMGAVNEAVQTLNAVLAAKPDFIPALVNRAIALTQLNRLDEAERDYLKLLETAPKMESVYYHLGEIDFQRGRTAEARRHYRRFLETATAGSPEALTAQQRLDAIAAGKTGG